MGTVGGTSPGPLQLWWYACMCLRWCANRTAAVAGSGAIHDFDLPITPSGLDITIIGGRGSAEGDAIQVQDAGPVEESAGAEQ